MDYITLKNSGIKVSRLCFGCEQLGLYNWGDIDVDDLYNAVNDAIDHGVNFFDTADVYGLGTSERNLSRFVGNRRKEAVIATKFGIRFDNNNKRYVDNSPTWIKTALESSLLRLKTDYIDLFQIHDWDELTPIEVIIETLNELKCQGKIRAFGFSNLGPQLIADYLNKQYFNSFSYEFSLANRLNEATIIEFQKSCSFLSYGSLGQGILSGKYNIDSRFEDNDRRANSRYENFFGEKLIKNIRIVDLIGEIALKYRKSHSQVAIRWILDYLDNAVVITGIKSTKQLKDNIAAFSWKMDREEIDYLDIISQ